MKTVGLYARRLEMLSKGLMVLVPSFFCIKWVHDSFPWLRLDYGLDTTLLAEMPWWSHRLLGMFVDGVSVSILLSGLILFIRLMRLYQSGEIFSNNAFRLLEKLSNRAFFWVIYNPLSKSILSVITTLHKQPGQRTLSITFGTDDIVNIFIFSCLCVIASVMREAYTLKSENDLTV